MDPTTLLNRPKPKVTAHVTKINSLVESSDSIKKSSTKLRRVFERGTYQKKTQLTVLNRYKRRLDSIQKQNDKRFVQKKQVKMKLPDIKKYAGNLFTAGSTNDPFKALAALAAFRSFQKGSKGDWGGALGSGLVAAGLLFGPSLLKGGFGLMRAGINPSLPSGGAGGASAAPPWWQKNTKSLSRSNQSYAKFIKGEADLGDKARLLRRGQITPTQAFSRGGPEALSKQPGKIGKAFGRFGKAIVPVAGAALGAVDATLRAQEGDVTGATIAGTSASLDALAAASAATGIGLPVAGLLSIASFGLDIVNLVRDLSGASEKEAQKNKPAQQDKLKKQTEQQKKLVEKKQESKGELTFSKTLNRYEKVVSKFQEFAKNFKLFGQEDLKQTQQRAARVENLIGNQDIIEEPGYEFTNYTAQYLTGDPNSPAFDESHGTSSNYHDHIAFSDRETAIRAYQYLESKGLDVTEFQGFDPVGGHSDNSYHYSGLAFDVPGYQWGATGPIDQRHYNGSRLVRKYLNEFFQKEKQNNPNLQSKGSQSQRRQPPPQQQSISPIFQQPNAQRPAGLSIGPGGFNIGGRPAAQMSAPKQPSRPIATNLPYQSGYAEPTIVPYPIVQQMQQQMMAQGSSGPVIISGPSEEQLLNSFYKKVLLNTLK